MGFRNSILGGVNLVRAAIQSPNFLTKQTGWRVAQDGSAEFNNVVIRGGESVGGVALYYGGTPGPGTLLLSIASQSGHDEYGNFYFSGLTVYGPSGTAVKTSAAGAGASVGFTPPAVSGVTWVDGYEVAGTASRNGANTPLLSIQSPTTQGAPGSGAGIQMYGAPAVPTGPASEIVLNAAQTTVASDMAMLGQITSYPTHTYTPVMTGAGSATWSTQQGWWYKIGPLIFFCAYFVASSAGSGTSTLSVSTPVPVDRTTRQEITAHISGVSTGTGEYTGLFLTGGSGAVLDRLSRSGTDLTGANINNNALFTIQGFYRAL